MVSSSAARPHFLTPLFLFLLALFVRGGLLYYRLAVLNTPLNRLGGSDVPGWLAMADHVARRGALAHWLMGARPPLFAIVIALVKWLDLGLLAAAVLQSIFGALTVLTGYLLAKRLLASASDLPHAEQWVLVAGIVMALDPASVSASATLLADPLFNLLLTAFLLNFARFVQELRASDLALSALWMALTMFTRSTGIYLWLAALLMLILLVRRSWKPAAVLAGVGLAVYLGWSARNLAHTGVFAYSLSGNWSLLFLRGLSAEHLATGESTDRLQVKYVEEVYYRATGSEADSVTPESFWDFFVAPTPAIYVEMGTLAREKLIRYWPYALLGTGIGAWRMFSLTADLPTLFQPIELIYHAVLYGFGLWGTWSTFRRRQWTLLVLTLVPILYMSGVTLAAQTSAMDTRMRTPLTAPLAILAVYGLASAIASVRRDTTPTGINP